MITPVKIAMKVKELLYCDFCHSFKMYKIKTKYFSC